MLFLRSPCGEGFNALRVRPHVRPARRVDGPLADNPSGGSRKRADNSMVRGRECAISRFLSALRPSGPVDHRLHRRDRSRHGQARQPDFESGTLAVSRSAVAERRAADALRRLRRATAGAGSGAKSLDNVIERSSATASGP
jgi:hypothetical protein